MIIPIDVFDWAASGAPKWRKKKIAELKNKVKEGGSLTSIEKSILKAWKEHYGRR